MFADLLAVIQSANAFCVNDRTCSLRLLTRGAHPESALTGVGAARVDISGAALCGLLRAAAMEGPAHRPPVTYQGSDLNLAAAHARPVCALPTPQSCAFTDVGLLV